MKVGAVVLDLQPCGMGKAGLEQGKGFGNAKSGGAFEWRNETAVAVLPPGLFYPMAELLVAEKKTTGMGITRRLEGDVPPRPLDHAHGT